MKKHLGMILGMYAMSEMTHAKEHQEFIEEIEKPVFKKHSRKFEPNAEPKKIIPKGCKEYFFEENGKFEPYEYKGVNYIFNCVALNEKSAVAKFERFLKNRE